MDGGGGSASVFAERVRTARKAAGLKVKVVAAALEIAPHEYRYYEREGILPISLMAGFCAITRCSPFYLLTGDRLAVQSSQYVAEVNGVLIPQNRCGAPCHMGRHWCDLSCQTPDDS